MHDDAIADNRANWDDRADVHARSALYDVAGFLADPARVSSVVGNDLSVLREHLPPSGIRGRSLLHLQCHIGIDTISWSRAGAVDIHGLDFWPNSLHHTANIERRFDTVVTSTGTIVWLPEPINWAESVRALLNPGGVFLIRDDHPILGAGGLPSRRRHADLRPNSSPARRAGPCRPARRASPSTSPWSPDGPRDGHTSGGRDHVDRGRSAPCSTANPAEEIKLDTRVRPG
ncbi:class I SAM-dependent methyltransferase [Nocardia sp. NPDC057227]|uniref:class I SAM-dependent methyltransferase n=1 Tax=Nocardia sp. NPDC057227 TaxID=3346056 RepID=UPI00363AA3CA